MSTGTLVAVVVMVLATVGMGAWMMTLDQRQDDLEQGGEAKRGSGVPSRDNGDEIGRLRREFEQVKLQVDVHEVTLSEVDGRQDHLDGALEKLSERLATLSTSGGDGDTVAVPAAEVGSLKQAIETVLDDRKAKERKERAESNARRYSGFLLADLEVTPDQRESVAQAILTYMDGRDELRKQYPADEDRAAREAAQADLEQRRNEELIRIVGAGGFSKMEERMKRVRRGGDGGRGRPPRGGRGR